jgi:hypothetical protein
MVEAQTTRRFQANLHRGGMGLSETRRLLELFAEHEDFERLRQQALKENALGKTSDHHVRAMIYAFKRRFLQPFDLPPAHLVGAAMHSRMVDAAKTQIILPYFLRSDALAEECYRKLVLTRLGSSQAHLRTTEVVAHLVVLSENHSELNEWSDYLSLRWSRGFLALLRHFGLMERHPRTGLRDLWLLPEAFAFFWLWFWQQDNSFRKAERSEIWELLQVDERRKNELLAEGELRHWWYHHRLGGIVQFQPRFTSVKEWLENGLA